MIDRVKPERRVPPPRIVTSLSFTIPGAPVPLARSRVGKGGHHYTPTKSAKYQKEGAKLAWIAMLQQHWSPGLRGPFRLTLVAHRKVDKGDLDNLAKTVADLLTKANVWSDDARMHKLVAEMTIDRVNPRMEILVELIA